MTKPGKRENNSVPKEKNCQEKKKLSKISVLGGNINCLN